MISETLKFCLRLSRAHSSLVRQFDGRLGSLHGIGMTDFVLLYHLSLAPEGKLRRVDLAERVGLTVSGVTRMLLPLEKRHIVTRESDAHDARVAFAVITEAGRQILDDAIQTAEYLSEVNVPASDGEALTTASGLLARIAGPADDHIAGSAR